MWPWCCRPHPDTHKSPPTPTLELLDRNPRRQPPLRPIKDAAGWLPAQGEGLWPRSQGPLRWATSINFLMEFSHVLFPNFICFSRQPHPHFLFLYDTDSILLYLCIYFPLTLSVSAPSPLVSSENHPPTPGTPSPVSTPSLVSECLHLYKELDPLPRCLYCVHTSL